MCGHDKVKGPSDSWVDVGKCKLDITEFRAVLSLSRENVKGPWARVWEYSQRVYIGYFGELSPEYRARVWEDLYFYQRLSHTEMYDGISAGILRDVFTGSMPLSELLSGVAHVPPYHSLFPMEGEQILDWWLFQASPKFRNLFSALSLLHWCDITILKSENYWFNRFPDTCTISQCIEIKA